MKTALLALSLLLVAPAAFAEVPFQFAAPGVRTPDDPHVGGVRLSVLHGRNQSVRGADLGFVAMSETDRLTGFRAVFGLGRVHGSTSGFAGSFVNIHTGTDRGANAAFINSVKTMERGANLGFINVATGYTMVDVGGLNVSQRSTVQVGFVNVTERIEGVQIGFLNAAENGFLPVFPFFNFPKR